MCFGSPQTAQNTCENKTISREMDPKHVHCFFRVHVNNTMPGDTVLLLGGSDAFGSWDSKKGLKLSTSSREFPWCVCVHVLCVCVCVCMYACMCTCSCVYLCMCTCSGVYVYMFCILLHMTAMWDT
jgi:hypothetical protein